MSEYFRVLKRIERDRKQPDNPTPRHVAPTNEDAEPAVASEPITSIAPLSPAAASGFSALFDNLRAVCNGQPLRSVVFVGAAPTDSVTVVVDGLTRHIQQLGLTVRRVKLNESAARVLLRRHQEAAMEGGGSAGDGGTPNLPALSSKDSSGAADLLFIEGRALSESIDAALVARACNGIVIVAAPGSTRRDALQAGVGRARAVGCRTLGLVVHGGTDPWPQWLRRLLRF